jgi:hypothetical protein
MFSRTTIPSPPFDQSICWKMRGITRGSRGLPDLSTNPSMNSGTMSSVPQPMWTSPAA